MDFILNGMNKQYDIEPCDWDDINIPTENNDNNHEREQYL